MYVCIYLNFTFVVYKRFQSEYCLILNECSSRFCMIDQFFTGPFYFYAHRFLILK